MYDGASKLCPSTHGLKGHHHSPGPQIQTLSEILLPLDHHIQVVTQTCSSLLCKVSLFYVVAVIDSSPSSSCDVPRNWFLFGQSSFRENYEARIFNVTIELGEAVVYYRLRRIILGAQGTHENNQCI